MKRNITDPDSKPMKNFRGFVQGYSGQAVATEEQIIIASELTNECNDQKQVEAIEKTLHEEKCETLLMDAGYCSETNLALEEKKRWHHRACFWADKNVFGFYEILNERVRGMQS